MKSFDSGIARAAARECVSAATRARPVPGALAGRVLLAIVVLTLGIAAGAAGERPRVDVEASAEPGFGRLVFTFPGRPRYEVKLVSGVLLVDFKKPVELRIDDVPSAVPGYIAVGRLDPDGRMARFALARELRVNTMEAGEELFVDLLPPSWTGAPPGLPKEVLARLQERALAAAEAARRDAARKAALAKPNKLDIHIGQQPTFSRISFAWDDFVDARIERDGRKVTIDFGKPAEADFSRLEAVPPRFVKSVRHDVGGEGLRVELTVDEASEVRGFREDFAYVVDIHAPVRGARGPRPGAGASQAGKGEGTEGARQEIAKLGGKGERAAPQPEKPAANGPNEPGGPAALPEPGDEPVVVLREHPLDRNGKAVADAPAAGDDTGTQAGPEAADAEHSAPPKTAAGASAGRNPSPPATAGEGSRGDTKPEGEAKPGASGETGSGRIVAAYEDTGEAVRLAFPFTEPTAAAVFRRARTLWIVFDTHRDIDTSAIDPDKSTLVSGIGIERKPAARVIRLDLAKPALATATTRDQEWVVTIGDFVAEPTAPVSLTRGLRGDGLAEVTVDFADAGKVHRLRDPAVGDRLAVVTGHGPARGFIKPQAFVEFTTLATAHGMALSPHADDLDVRLAGEQVVISRAQGLTLSAGRIQQYAPGRAGGAPINHPSFIDFDGWSRGGVISFNRNLEDLQTEIAAAQEDKGSLRARLDLVRLYLAHRLAGEALGQLRRVREIDAGIEADPMFNAMRGVANLLMDRRAEARRDLDVHGLSQDPHTKLWRALLAARARKWRAARRYFSESDELLREYPARVRAMFLVEAAQAAIETNDLGAAEFNLDALPEQGLSLSLAAQARLLRGRLLQALGRIDEALAAYEGAIATGDQKAEAEALYRSVLLEMRQGEITPRQAIPRLETVSLLWRGDELELNTLRKLADLYAREGRYARALKTMGTAVRAYPSMPGTELVQRDMVRLYKDLFLNDKADKLPPVQALSLYYEFRELTPIGREGDEMIRKLADRLVAVDLLDPAAELLKHQVDKRLTGAARARVATRLALVQLMAHEPAKALRTIRRSRQAIIPKALKRQRVMLESRALAELGRANMAVALLDNMDGDDAERLRAEAWWRGEKWQQAGESFERLLGTAWEGEAALSDEQRLDAMRAAISYAMAGDDLGLARFRKKFLHKMSESPDGEAFRVIAGTSDRTDVAFRNLAKEIAAIDTLESFLKQFRKSLEATSSLKGTAKPKG